MENDKCCPILKVLISILILAAVFCLGTMVGSHRDGFRKDSEKQKGTLNSGAGSVTVKVLPDTTVTQ